MADESSKNRAQWHVRYQKNAVARRSVIVTFKFRDE
jgi:hypothetical protein